MIQSGMPQQIADRSSHTRLLIPCAEDHPLHARQHDRAGAHCAGFECDIEGAVIESPAIELRGRLANREELSVSGGILIADGAIGRCSQDCTVADYDRADGNFVALRRIAGEIEGVSNVLLVGSEGLRADAERLGAPAVISRQVLALSLS